MQSSASTFNEYIDSIPEERRASINKMRKVLKANLPRGFKEIMAYGYPGFVVPHSTYPAGYHVDPTQPLPFVGYASQKNFVALYHYGVYASPKLYKWFVAEYPKHVVSKLDMGKSCIRFKNLDQIPYDLIAQLSKKISVNDWIKLYENNLKDSRKK